MQKYLLWISSSFLDIFIQNRGKKAVPKSNCHKELLILKKWMFALKQKLFWKKWLLRKSDCSEKRRKKQLLWENSYSENVTVVTKYSLRKSVKSSFSKNKVVLKSCMYHKRLNVSNVSIPEEATHQRCSLQKAVLKNFRLSIGKPLHWTLFLIELQVWRPAIVLKETLTKVFACEYCENFKNTFFQEYLQTTVSAVPASYC